MELTTACYQECRNVFRVSLSYNKMGICTITCSNVFSIHDIFHDYHEHSYEQNLTISESNVTVLNPDELSKFAPARYLYLAGIHIKEVLPGAFNGLTQLTELHLEDNHLSELRNGVLDPLRNLRRLYLSNNQLKRIEPQAFIGTSTLFLLDIGKNRLTNIEDSLCDTPHLFELIVSGNHLTKLSLRNMTFLEKIDLTDMGITNLEKFSLPIRLEGLFLSFNNITNIEEDSFGDLTSLTDLYLDRNKISKIPVNLFQNLTNLIILDLSYNLIESFEIGTFDRLVELNYLNISHNKLNILTPFIFTSMLKLEKLRLDFNNLSNLNVTELTGHYSSLGLEGNNFDCTDLIQIYFELQAAKVKVESGSSYDGDNFRGIACHKTRKPSSNITNRMKQIIEETLKSSANASIEELMKYAEMSQNSTKEGFDINKEMEEEVIKSEDQAQVSRSQSKNNRISGVLVTEVILQIIFCILLVCLIFALLKYFRKRQLNVSNLPLLENTKCEEEEVINN